MAVKPERIGAAKGNALIRLAIDYSDALDRCTQTKGANIDELMSLLRDDVVRTSEGGSQVGKDAVRLSFLGRAQSYEQEVELKGIDVWGDLVVCRLERKDTTHTQAGVEHHVRILMVKDGLIKRITVVLDPEEDARLRA